jgi:hypothetical protein
MEANFERTKEVMADDPNPMKRLAKRVVGCFKLLC